MERDSFKLVPFFFLKLSFFFVFVGDFCFPPRSSGLAPNEGHEKRWHLGMARLLHGRTGQWWLCEHASSAFKRHVRYPYGMYNLNYFVIIFSMNKNNGNLVLPLHKRRKEKNTKPHPHSTRVHCWWGPFFEKTSRADNLIKKSSY